MIVCRNSAEPKPARYLELNPTASTKTGRHWRFCDYFDSRTPVEHHVFSVQKGSDKSARSLQPEPRHQRARACSYGTVFEMPLYCATVQ